MREWRKKRKLTQEEVAQKIGTTRGHYLRLEKGTNKLNERWLNDLSRVFGCFPKDLIADDSPPLATTPLDGSLMAEVSAAIARVADTKQLKLTRQNFLDLCVELYNYVQKYRAEREAVEVNLALAEMFMNTKQHAS